MPSYPRWRGPPILFPELFSFMLISEYHPLPRKNVLMTEKDFALLVREHKSTIYTVCHMFASDQDEVNDLFQDTLINLWRGYDSFKGQSKLNSWIYRVALNTCISADRKKRRKPTIPLEMDINLYEDTDADSRQIQLLYKRIHRLKPFDRAIVLLWLESLPYDEIGAIVGISAKNVSVRLVRIREELKKMKD